MARIGLLAGIGTLPVEFLRAAHKDGHQVVTVAVVAETEPELEHDSDVFYHIHVAKINSIIKTLVKEGVHEVTMLGKVTKELLFKGLPMPEFRTLRVLKELHNRKDDTIMLAIVQELEKDGIKVLDQTIYMKSLMPTPQIFTKRQPTPKEWEDIRFGFKVAKDIGGLDIGQTVVVKDKAVMAVEAIEGTDACIKRGCSLAREAGIVVKTAKPAQDVRFDVPTIGCLTVQTLVDGKGSLLAIEAERTIFVERDKVLKLANENNICICAVESLASEELL